MQFIIYARDYTDNEALSRRLSAREAHLALCDQAIQTNTLLYAVAMLNDAGTMCGSMMVVDMPNRAAVEAWLAVEPYVKGKVWENIEVIPGKVGPAFLAKQ